MRMEVEQKARIEEPDSIKRVLDKKYGLGIEIDKEDQYYWIVSGDDYNSLKNSKKVRLRRENQKWTCTSKEKTIENGTEKNKEIEFTVDDIISFKQFLDYLGFSFLCSKQKKGWKYVSDDMCIELCNVGHLGWFLEVEIVTDEDNVSFAENKIISFMKDMGLSSSIEERPYLELLCKDKN
ncbi:class IV adenylate cyclase [Spirochaetia bacterium 38H-sp]|uniref:Class IV adenylate cyclase n=1 Tax=Rarispira pelagica TaxID=3141764 RepID=A0ABU9UD62_9SPIR